MANIWSYTTAVGRISLVSDNGYLIRVFLSEDNSYSNENYTLKEDELIKEAFLQVQEYLCGKRKFFTVPYKLSGTFFQQKVFECVSLVPYGSTVSYSYIAEKINIKGACRAVGNALNKNPLLLVIPCHRVVLKSGSYGGFAYNKFIKEYLINLEKINK